MSRSSSRRSTRSAVDAFPLLSQGIQNGLQRLVRDNVDTVARMLQVSRDDDDNDNDNDNDTFAMMLCEKCAKVMHQQDLSASLFLARFFHVDVLSRHASQVLHKSPKGSAATLADRIASEWAKNKDFPLEEEEEEDAPVIKSTTRAQAAKQSTPKKSTAKPTTATKKSSPKTPKQSPAIKKSSPLQKSAPKDDTQKVVIESTQDQDARPERKRTSSAKKATPDNEKEETASKKKKVQKTATPKKSSSKR